MKEIHKTCLLAVSGRQLLVIEKIGRKKRFTLPGGIQKKKETIVESLERETVEEIGLKLNAQDAIHMSTSSLKAKGLTTKHYFLLHIKTNDFGVI